MPWKNNPELIQVVLGFFAMLGAAGVGVMAKIADDVKTGERPKFWSKELLLEVPAWLMMAMIGAGLVIHYDLSQLESLGLGCFLGWIGPKAIDVFITYRFGRRIAKENAESRNKED